MAERPVLREGTMDQEPLLKEPKPTRGPEPSGALSPSDHLRLLVDLLKPVGPEIARRWVAALILIPEEERLAVIESVEAEIVRQYGSDKGPSDTPDDA